MTLDVKKYKFKQFFSEVNFVVLIKKIEINFLIIKIDNYPNTNTI
jgi:hypothetical protein